MAGYHSAKYKGLWFVLPSCVGVFALLLLPLLDVVLRAFSNTTNEKWVGLHNFKMVIRNKAFQTATVNMIEFICVCIPLLLILSLLTAVLLQEKLRINMMIKKGFLLPMAIPAASVVFLWQMIFHRNGFLNGFLNQMGMSGADWMNSRYAFGVLVLSYLWKNMGYNMILWIVGLANIPKEIYEAARVDGAGRGRTFISITLPNLHSTFYMVLILSLLNSFKVFREAYLVAGSYPQQEIYMLQHLYNNWFVRMSLDKMAAGAVIIMAVMFALVLVIQKAWEREGAGK